MAYHEQVARIRELVEPHITGRGFEIIELHFFPAQARSIVRLLVDRPQGGITMDECVSLNRQLGEILESAQALPERSVIEVSSPGLDRPLMTKNDFLRCLNRQVRFFLNAPLEGVWEVEGAVVAVHEEAAEVLREATPVRIPFAQIVRARQVF